MTRGLCGAAKDIMHSFCCFRAAEVVQQLRRLQTSE